MTTIVVTIFRDLAAATKIEVQGTLDDLAALIRRTGKPTKSELPLLKLGRFGDQRSARGSLRHDANLLTITGVEADYDAGEAGVEAVVHMLGVAGVSAIVYTSPRHTAEHPRWRVLCLFSEELRPTDRDRMLGRLNGALGCILATESWTLSQAYFFGAIEGNDPPRVEIVEGQPIDTLDGLDATASGKLGPKRTPADKNPTAGLRHKLLSLDPTRNPAARAQTLITRLEKARPGSRGTWLNWTAIRFGHMLGEGRVNRQVAESCLVSACRINGLWAFDGAEKVQRQIDRGLRYGIAEWQVQLKAEPSFCVCEQSLDIADLRLNDLPDRPIGDELAP